MEQKGQWKCVRPVTPYLPCFLPGFRVPRTREVKVVFQRPRFVTLRLLGRCYLSLIHAHLPGCMHLFTLSRLVTSYLPFVSVSSFHNFGKSSFSSRWSQMCRHSFSITLMLFNVNPRAITRLLPLLFFLTISSPFTAYLPHFHHRVLGKLLFWADPRAFTRLLPPLVFFTLSRR